MIKLSYVCFGNHSGYSQAAQDTILALNRNGQYDIRLQFVLNTKLGKAGLSDERYKLFSSLMKKPASNKDFKSVEDYKTEGYPNEYE